MRVMIRCSPRLFAPTTRLWRGTPLALTLAAFACVGEPADIASPSRSAAVPRRSSSASDGFVTCDVAVQTSANTYRVRKASIELPMTIRDSASSLVKFMFLAWRHDGRDPARFAGCQVPNSPQALAYFEAIFRSGTTPIVPGSDQSVRVANSHARERPGQVRNVDVDEGTCPSDGPVDFGCGCSASTCAGWTTATVNSVEPQPPDQGDVEMTVSSSSDYYDPEVIPQIIVCTIHTDDAHWSDRSYMISVHGWTNCTSPVKQLISTISLQKETCLDYDPTYCWFETLAYNIFGPWTNAYLLDAQAIAPCVNGWYSGITAHSVVFGAPYVPLNAFATTYGRWKYITCGGGPQ